MAYRESPESPLVGQGDYRLVNTFQKIPQAHSFKGLKGLVGGTGPGLGIDPMLKVLPSRQHRQGSTGQPGFTGEAQLAGDLLRDTC